MSAVRFTAKQVLEQIFSNDSDCDEDADEEASEEEDGEEYNPEDEETTEDDDDDDYDAAAAAADDEDNVQVEQVERETFVSRNGQIQWCSVPCDNNRGVGGAAAAAKSNRPVAEVPEDMRPGPTRQAVGQARDILSTFRLFFTPEIEDIILEMTNLEGRKRCQVCPTKKDCKTHTVCTRCNKYICKGCSHPYCPTCSNWAFSERGTVRPGGHGVCTEYQDNGR
ncbi:unnamed protein product, partial [Coregonus sp. 'balchen']